MVKARLRLRGVDGFSLGILRGEEGKPSATPKSLNSKR